MFLDNLQYRNYEDLNKLIYLADFQAYRDFDLVVGVPRSGMIPAYMIGLILNLPVLDIESFISGLTPYVGNRIQQKQKKVNKVLVVDDSIIFGRQLHIVKEKLSQFHSVDFKYLTIFATSDSRSLVDCCLEIIDHPRVFQWNLMNSWIFEYSCVDIDGVLCEDPTAEENDDGEKYKHFLHNALPKYLPPCNVDVLVTSRLEKYRLQTEFWLRKHGVKYNNLEMLDLPDKETRVKLGAHAIFKSKIYHKYDRTALFIESSKSQSESIHNDTGKNVFCVETMTFYFKRMDNNENYLKRLWRNLKKG
jgi:uncharacterized HAD superfamily protein/hypoxanthine phosphoribosyltransferase